MEGDKRDLREIAKAIEGEGVCCNCDLDNWEPERTTGHSHVCRIHKRAMMMKFRPHDMRAPNDLGNRRAAGPIGGASVLTDELAGNGKE